MSLTAITPEGTYEVRLIEPMPFNYSVAVRHRVPGSEVAAVARELMDKDAVEHAAQWADFGYVASAYQVKVSDVTGQWAVPVPFQL
ncbi:hypothetical protein AB0N77_21855 [Streptomyces misionensis]|uniref:hypothetical protein n=1 Tax=Streptomyces misionensis TaxID=67331 RepID=UPI0034452890